MKKSTLVCCIILIAINSFSQDRTAQFDSLFTSLYKKNEFTGNVLIAEKGKPIFQKSYGKSFREKNLDLNSESIFELASVSKQFTAMAIMILKKQGKLNYEDSLRKFFPQLPYYNISIRQLLNHTSGLPDYMNLARSHWDNKLIMNNGDMISMLAEKKPKPLFVSGEKWEYSNTGYALLASIVEKVSGQGYKQFMEEQIFNQLGMRRSLVFHKRLEKRTIDNYAYGYVKEGGSYVMADSSSEVGKMVYSLDGIFGDGIINSTVTDLLKWDNALYTEKLVSKEMMKEAFTPVRLNNGTTFSYGFGWLLKDSKEHGSYMFHGGGWPGYSTWIERHPKSKQTIIILANAGTAIDSIKQIRNILFGIENKPPVEINVSTEVLQQYTGTYLFSNNDTLHVMLQAGKLMAGRSGQKKHQLYPEAVDLFFRKDRDVKIHFVKSNGKTIKVVYYREGPDIEAVKIK